MVINININKSTLIAFGLGFLAGITRKVTIKINNSKTM